MTGKHMMALVAMLLVLTALPSTAQDITVTTQTGTTTVPVNGQLNLSVTISGADANSAGEPDFTPMPTFAMQQTGTSRSIEIVNFKTSVAITYTYRLAPSETGTFEVGEAHVTVGGKNFTSRPVTVTVTDAQTGAPAQSPSGDTADEIFVVGSVDKNTVYVGEQVTYTFELYNRRTISDIEYEAPTTTGFWTTELPTPPATLKVYGQYQYNYNVLVSALFPTTDGTLTIGSASVTFQPRLSFFTSGPAQRLATKPIEIEVMPLPVQGRPAGFNGAVGAFRINAATAQDTIRAGDVLSITISVTGDGNLDLVTGLTEPDFAGFRTYPSRVVDTIRNSGERVGGIKTWEYMVAPRQQGAITIQPFSIVYFDPSDERYHTSSTEPITLTVLPGSPSDAAAPSAELRRDGMTPVAADIRYLKPDKVVLVTTSRKVYASWLFYLAYLLPACLLAAAVFYRRRRDIIEHDTGLRRKLNAWKYAQRRLKDAESRAAADDLTGFCGALHESVTGYIGDMLDIDTGALTANSLETILRGHGIPAELAANIRKTLEMCDFVRFASIGAGSNMENTLLTDTAGHLAKLRELL